VDDPAHRDACCGRLGVMRPILRPGTHVLQRGAGEVQVGLDPASALVLPDSPAVRRTVRRLAAPADAGVDVDPPTLDLLARHGLLADADDLLRGHAASRDDWRTETRTFGHAAGEGLREGLISLLRSAGIREASPRRAAAPDLGVLVGVGEPDRELLDAWTRGGTPYLLVRLTEGRAVVGPFVAPGSTACLRCLDAHHTDVDAAWPLLVRQYAAASSCDRPDGAAEPVDPLLASLALAWAARDVASYVDGARPTTWSSTLTLHPLLSRIETRTWLRHPGCCCTWD
jgi:bacteriocin biosynthesis cyclodehydratase domain-containing protein